MISIEQFKIQLSDAAGQNVNTPQPWFPTTGGMSMLAGVAYFFDGLLWLTRSAGAISHTTSLLFGGTATLTSIMYMANVMSGQVASNSNLNATAIDVATAVVVKAASTTATEQITAEVKGIVRVNAAGTFIPQYKYSAAPGGAPTIKANSYFKLTPIGTDISPQGVWT